MSCTAGASCNTHACMPRRVKAGYHGTHSGHTVGKGTLKHVFWQCCTAAGCWRCAALAAVVTAGVAATGPPPWGDGSTRIACALPSSAISTAAYCVHQGGVRVTYKHRKRDVPAFAWLRHRLQHRDVTVKRNREERSRTQELPRKA